MFWIKGLIGKVEQEIVYDIADNRGSLTGDEGILFLVNMELERKSIVGPVGQYYESDIDNPLSVLFVIRKCFDEILEAGGEIPKAEAIPEGCIC